MRKRSDPAESMEELREKIIGFGERSGRKSFYPELRESEQRFRAVFEGAAIAIGVIDLQGRVQATNLEFQSLLSQSAEQLRGKRYLALIHPEDRECADEHHRRLLRGKVDRVRLELRLARADGQTAWAHVSTSLVAGTGSAPAYLVVAIQDISLRKRAQDALEFLSQASVRLASSLELTATLRSLPELAVPFLGDLCAICLLTSEGKCEQRALVCRDHEKKSLAEKLLEGRLLTGLVEEAPTGTSCAAPRLFPDASGALRAAAARDPARLELVRRLDLRSLMLVPLVSGGRVLGSLMLATGESGRRYGQLDLELAMEFGHRAALALENARLLLKAQEANRIKEEFLAVVSHELRTPLTSILGWVGLLQSKKLDSGAAIRGLTVIDRNARFLAQIIEDLLGISRIMAGKLQIHPSPVDLAPVIEAAVEGLRPSADASRIALDVRCAPGVPAVSGDAKRLQQIIWNLVSNAVKNTPVGGEVRVRLARSRSSAVISVSDTGRGISPEFLPQVFARFRQADGSITRGYAGLGLGLAIVRHLVELHGGTVRATSEGEGRGACFTVTLPLASGDVAPGLPRHEPGLPTLEDVRVLIVEDDADTLELIGEVLRRQGAQVAVANSAKGALTELDRAVPDVLISDIAMSELDGVELLKTIQGRGWRIPAVALTALAREEDRGRALAAGFEHYFVKPADIRELLVAVAGLASARQASLSGA
ncbi:MAG: hypothetical protein A2V77_11535 [Anaeromyxobacter sp. RBG_16_69_14]|nr:MAG: hypothetical protein A2V77_11535 [Anaeromyxobacter sp. RBG_16_69_14]